MIIVGRFGIVGIMIVTITIGNSIIAVTIAIENTAIRGGGYSSESGTQIFKRGGGAVAFM